MFKWYYYLMMVAFATLTPLWGTTPAAAADQEAEQGMSPVNSRDDSAASRRDSAADEDDGLKNLAQMVADFCTEPHTQADQRGKVVVAYDSDDSDDMPTRAPASAQRPPAQAHHPRQQAAAQTPPGAPLTNLWVRPNLWGTNLPLAAPDALSLRPNGGSLPRGVAVPRRRLPRIHPLEATPSQRSEPEAMSPQRPVTQSPSALASPVLLEEALNNPRPPQHAELEMLEDSSDEEDWSPPATQRWRYSWGGWGTPSTTTYRTPSLSSDDEDNGR